MTGTLAGAWRIYRERFGTIAAVVATVWIPCEMLSSYMDYFVFDPDDFRKSFRFAQLLENTFGIIATAGVIYISSCASTNVACSYGPAMSCGFRSWGRMWWTRLVSGLAIILCLLLLIIPGIYVAVRLMFVENIAVLEREYGTAAIKRSYELTRDRFWETFGFACVIYLSFIFACFLLYLPVLFIETLDVWWLDTMFMVVTDLLAAYLTIAIFVRYRELSEARSNTAPSGAAA